MTGIGTIVNVLAVVVGGALGMLLRGGMKQQYQQAIPRVMGVCTIFIAVSGALTGLLFVEDGKLVGISAMETLAVILAMALGTLVGEWIDIDGKLQIFGAWLKKKATRGEDNLFIEGFVTSSLVVCIGAMAIVGSIQDALAGDPSTLFTKSTLDFITCMIFASSYGKGVLFSAIPVGLLQGSVTILASLVAPVFSPPVIAMISLLGNLMIFCVGCNLALDSRFRVANMLPALVFGSIFTLFL